MKVRLERKSVLFLVLIFLASSLFAVDINKLPPDNWAVAARSPARSGGLGIMTSTPNPTPFQTLNPCRIVDTRALSGFPASYGPPSLAAGVPRNFTLSGQCGIPGTASAVSLNVTVTNPAGDGFILIFPAGGSQPGVSTLNYVAGQTIANAAIVPLGSGGAVTVIAGVSGTNLILDTNGYFYDGIGFLPAGEQFSIRGSIAGGGSIYGLNNNATGYGVWGDNVNGIGVFGSSSTNVGTKGKSTNYNGVWAESTNQDGLFASGGREGAYIQGARNGAIIHTSGTTGDTAGVFGTDGASASGGLTTGWFSAGVRGQGKNGVVGITNTGVGNGVTGVAISPATTGVIAYGDLSATGAKPFIEPHPTDPMMTIRYVALEGPEAGTYFRGTAKTVDREAVIPVPDSFRIVTAEEGLTVQLTPVGELAQMAVMSQDLNQIVVRSSREVTFHYHVNGIRRAFKDWQVVAEGHEFRPVSPDQKMPGWLTEEAKSRLISNGTYNPDGTVNMNTAERMGWAKVWREEAATAAASRK